MKILGIVCSPRNKGNTELLVAEVLSNAKDLGAEVELLNIANRNIAPCDACDSCKRSGKCKITDDMDEIYSKLLEADGIIFGTPVYFWSVAAQAKCLIDRTYALREKRKLRNKVAGIVVVARRAGATHAFSELLNFFNIQRMISAGGVIAYADVKGEVSKDRRGMAEARSLGRAIVRTIERNKELI